MLDTMLIAPRYRWCCTQTQTAFLDQRSSCVAASCHVFVLEERCVAFTTFFQYKTNSCPTAETLVLDSTAHSPRQHRRGLASQNPPHPRVHQEMLTCLLSHNTIVQWHSSAFTDRRTNRNGHRKSLSFQAWSLRGDNRVSCTTVDTA